jgi:hypothetical protein
VNRSLLIADKIVMSSHINMTILVKIREKSLSERDYIFNSKREILLDLEEDFFNHILINNSMRILVKNTSNQTYVILKNYKLDKICDYQKNECFLIFSNDNHLIIVSNKLFSQKSHSRKLQDREELKTVLFNEIIVHENEKIVKRIADVINKYLNVWKNISKTVNVSENRWMKIKTIFEANSDACRVYKFETENQIVIDKEFDVLHALSKMKWAFESILYVYSVFVVWTTTHLMRKSSTRREKVIVNIRDLNKIFEHDAYFMLLQSDILSKTQSCLYISIMNCTTFFHQWRVTISDRHKLIVVTHRETKQWNVDVMSHRNTDAYVQREMNNILRKYSWVKTYIDDVIVFSKTLKKHLEHLNQLFALFETLNITLKTKKTYLEYSSISLLEQKVNSLNFIIAEDKLKAIVKLSFLKTLKNLEKYFEVIKWLRDYVTYYAQKAEPLQERKTNLLKKDSMKRYHDKSMSDDVLLFYLLSDCSINIHESRFERQKLRSSEAHLLEIITNEVTMTSCVMSLRTKCHFVSKWNTWKAQISRTRKSHLSSRHSRRR